MTPGVFIFGFVDYKLSGHFMQLVTTTKYTVVLNQVNHSVVKQPNAMQVFTVRLILSYNVIGIFWR